MDPNQLTGWIEIGKIAVVAGIAGWSEISGWIHKKNPEISDAELNQILEGVKQDATARKKMAEADAGGV